MPVGLTITVDPASLNRVKETLRRKPELLKKQVAGALNDTAKHAKSEVSSLIRERVNIKKKDVDEFIYVVPAYPANLVATVVLEKKDRIPLKDFGARQTKSGVTYRIVRGGGKDKIADAFGPNIPRLGGHVYRRKGAARLPIVKLFGPSAWGVFVKNGLHKLVKKDSNAYLANRLRHRIEYQMK